MGLASWFKHLFTPPPPLIPPPTITLGTRVVGKRLVACTLSPAERRTHKVCLGVSGMGKSVFIATYCIQLLKLGIPFLLLDPHSDTARLVVQLAADHGFFRTPAAFAKLWYVDFAHPQRVVPFNVLRQPLSPYHTAEQAMEALRRAFPTGEFAAALENVGLFAFLTLAAQQRPVTDMLPLLLDGAYRAWLVRGAPADARLFWERFERWGASAVESTVRRLNLLTFNPAVRGSLGQPENLLEARRLIEQRVSVLCDVGGLDAQSQKLVSCLLTVGLEGAVYARRDLPEEQRHEYHIILDEYPQVAPGSAEAIAHLLDRARKWGVSLTAIMQRAQHMDSVVGAFQNAATIAFRVGEHDAATLAGRFTAYDEGKVKYPARTATARPVFYSRSEQRQLTAETLAQLEPRVAMLRLGSRIETFQTLGVTPPREDITPILDEYARRLLRPAAAPEQQVRTEGAAHAAPPPERRQEERRYVQFFE